MATVMLQPASTIDLYPPGLGDSAPTHAVAVQTLLDGSFSIERIAPGAYYVFAWSPGYVSPLASLETSAELFGKPNESARRKLATEIQRVTIQSGLPAFVDLTLRRGAAVSGAILFDDGSPAAGLPVRLLVHRRNRWVPIQLAPFEEATLTTNTDDQGAYRMSGLPEQEYLLEVDLHLVGKLTYSFGGGGSGITGSGGYSVPIYSGGTWRPDSTAAFVLKLGDERLGEDIQIPLNKLHNVSGVITAAQDGHVVNAGTVALLHPDDRSEAASTYVTGDDGNRFTLNFVPEGDYILQVTGASDRNYVLVPNPPNSIPATRTASNLLHSYGRTEQPVHVSGDLSGLTVEVPEVPIKKTDGSLR
jgi:hypothetical protein